ncbi:hypothetical protein H6G54_02720 [Anabaena cylindrica FACHB-243]|uniref:Uncharacterized protein n=1 Tax=Anabaena cylindrica (strain ATCC 27899 / PCC 7122) TaxID=272123 RepID=K9ZQ58_ANACC|nr:MULTISPECIES: hypothetical protein [Anabaena]AFZ61301.1 hypothetical protein Anacy_6023 [Anabaena cylindrica PCC 7122]AZL96595.1 hypothetical protein [Anabaena sp. CCAP 1446/1C]MBD2416640.1 hypothetical protein [Anabaena cylindrica FACHB-243]MBY5281122.1 hypothetical protein [Anabaena sp. CCAP 1446/1C]MBY5306748.1 hypothetical protein [Anabaena sp. CCAP 1446/1C]
MKNRLNSLVGLGLLGAIASLGFMPQAIAIPYNSNTVYKTVSEGVTTVYISGTPSGTASVALGFIDRFSSRVAGSCGEVRLSATTVGATPTVQVGSPGVSVEIENLPVQLLPTCTSGSFAEARPNNFKTPSGEVVIVGQTANTAVLLNIPRDTTRTVRLNACGFGTLRNTSSFSIPPTFSVEGVEKTLATLPNAGNAPRCTSGVGYVPSAWIGGT